ncbi:DUF6344 domain-containing protein [Streptomyces sp. NBC_01476]|uniref:DUF6344 domain-containing protein n=1 Tax=Streptomyces sp. NBC_01476 TaxID=2903881 RepID=UPI002E34B264|nr:DUF6344 domain-containing protein [Streptomyces sp. NBC_01476]
MAVTGEIRTFWGALLSVLLKCIAALGFATPANRTVAAHPVAVLPEAGRPAAPRTVAKEVAAAAPRVPAPRSYESSRRERTLPPTMKQRINAEAHGSSPSARSVRTGDVTEEITAALALADAAASPSGTVRTAPAGIPRARTAATPTAPARIGAPRTAPTGTAPARTASARTAARTAVLR